MTGVDALQIWSDIAAADRTSYAIVGVMTLAVFAIMRTALSTKLLAILFAPAIFWSGLTGIYLVPILGLSIPGEKTATAAAAAGCAMIVTVLVLTLLARGIETALDGRAASRAAARAGAAGRNRI
ncbi:hypothetical protein [Hyphomicrobium sp.]|uniref:hypothetical protein n=1 Tax=Hyphomicrobium sp. TaxID=82 RepID=UPI002FDDEAF6